MYLMGRGHTFRFTLDPKSFPTWPPTSGPSVAMMLSVSVGRDGTARQVLLQMLSSSCSAALAAARVAAARIASSRSISVLHCGTKY